MSQHCACKPTWSYAVRMLPLCVSIQPDVIADLCLDSSAFFLFACTVLFFLSFFYLVQFHNTLSSCTFSLTERKVNGSSLRNGEKVVKFFQYTTQLLQKEMTKEKRSSRVSRLGSKRASFFYFSSSHSFQSPRCLRFVMAFRCLTLSHRSAALREWKVKKNSPVVNCGL